MKKNLFDYLWILRPSYWLMNNDFSLRWDTKLLELLKQHKFEAIDMYTARLGSLKIWIKNHPYSSFYPWSGGLPQVRPSRSTISFARRRLLDDLLIDDDPFPRDEVEELRTMYAAPERGDSK